MKQTLNFIYSDIGRGHAQYLDGIVEALRSGPDKKLEITCHSVFALSQGISAAAWKMARWLYNAGSSNSQIRGLYQSLRANADYNKQSFSLQLLSRDVGKKFSDDDFIVVDHPILVVSLKGRKHLFYQHGELAVPDEALVKGASCVFVPTEEAAQSFRRGGYSSDSVLVTGLCVDPLLASKAREAFQQRTERLRSSPSLNVAFFSSGAEPAQHLRLIQLASRSLSESGHTSLVFARRNGRLHKLMRTENVSKLILFDSRDEERLVVREHFMSIDCMVSPFHERSSWALGLGLPIFGLLPAIGSFAPLNKEILSRAGVASVIATDEDAIQLGRRLTLPRSDNLVQMSHNGTDKHSLDGFSIIAAYLSQRLAET